MERERKPPAVRGAPVAPPEDTWKVLVGCAVLLVLFPIWLVAAPRWYAALGELHESKGRLTSAVNAYDRALAVWPRLFDASELLFNRAVLLMSTEDAGSPRHADTEADLRTLLASQPDDANVNFNLGVVLSEMVDGGKFDGAKAYKDAKALNMMTVTELHRRYHDSTGITFSSMYPGCIAETNLFREKRQWFRDLFPVFMKTVGAYVSEREAEQLADCVLRMEDGLISTL